MPESSCRLLSCEQSSELSTGGMGLRVGSGWVPILPEFSVSALWIFLLLFLGSRINMNIRNRVHFLPGRVQEKGPVDNSDGTAWPSE